MKPEILYSQNKGYPGFPTLTEEEEAIWPNKRRWPTRYRWWNRADIPEQYGEESLNKIYWGQSFAQVSFGKFALKASTENLWWGPGKYNSLLMTNNAKGFPHLSLNTTSPVKTPLGSFEMQMIVGKLENSGFVPPDTSMVVNETQLYDPKIEDERLLNGIALAYQPKWVKGLYVGFISTIQQYSEIAKENGHPLPIFSNFLGAQGLANDTSIWDKKASIF